MKTTGVCQMRHLGGGGGLGARHSTLAVAAHIRRTACGTFTPLPSASQPIRRRHISSSCQVAAAASIAAARKPCHAVTPSRLQGERGATFICVYTSVA
eukprot:3581665-Pyramimonas_sp.AAC.1